LIYSKSLSILFKINEIGLSKDLANEQFLSILSEINSKAAWLAVAGIIVVFQFYPRST